MHFQKKTENVDKIEWNLTRTILSILRFFFCFRKREDLVTINNNYSAWVDNLKKTESKGDFYYFSILFYLTKNVLLTKNDPRAMSSIPRKSGPGQEESIIPRQG